jgi:hypothetical protein
MTAVSTISSRARCGVDVGRSIFVVLPPRPTISSARFDPAAP